MIVRENQKYIMLALHLIGVLVNPSSLSTRTY